MPAMPEPLREAYVPRALGVEDTDWHLERLYGFAAELGASVLVPQLSRYVIDLNRPPDDAPMYPGASNTELCPTRFFSGEPLYQDGRAPSDAEVAQRVAIYWQPYHDALAHELDFLRKYVDRRPPLPLTLRQVDPLIRQLSLYRDLIDQKTGGSE